MILFVTANFACGGFHVCRLSEKRPRCVVTGHLLYTQTVLFGMTKNVFNLSTHLCSVIDADGKGASEP
jgi:hypothetical protein